MSVLADLEAILREAAQAYRADGEERHAETLFNVLTTVHEVPESTAVLFMVRWLGADEDGVDLDAIEDAMLLAAADRPPRNATEFIEQCSARLARS